MSSSDTRLNPIRMKPGYGYDAERAAATYTGEKRIVPEDARFMTEIVQVGDYEGELTWVIGLTSKQPLEVSVSGAPESELAIAIGR